MFEVKTVDKPIIKPNKLKEEGFFNALPDFENNLLNRLTVPKYTSIYKFPKVSDEGVIIYDTKTLTWPVTDGYNIDFVCEESELQASLWTLVIGLFAMSMTCFGLFLISINREYLGTFFDTNTGPQFAVICYHEAKTDEARFATFMSTPSYYSAIVGELLTWLDANWDKWEEEKPDWFTASAIASIPEDMLPVRVKNKLGGTKQERRNSLNKQIAEESKAKIEKQERAQRDGDVDPVR